jgi:uncharacterized protein YcbK (DUF882 family)
MPTYTEGQLKHQREVRDRRQKTLKKLQKRTKRYHQLVAKARARLAMMRKANRDAKRTGQLSEHFNVHCKDGTKVPSIAIPALRRLCREYLEPMRRKFGPCVVYSGYRTPAYNARVGGARYSEHIYTMGPTSVAADTAYRTGTPAQWAAHARSLPRVGGVGRYDRSGFVHIDTGVRRDWSG